MRRETIVYYLFFIDFLFSWISEQNNSNEKKKKIKKLKTKIG